MSSLIDTGGPARFWLAGREQALQQQGMQQREEQAAQYQQNQQRAFDLRRMEQEAEVAKMQLQQRAAAARAQILREDILSKLPQSQMAQGMGPVQSPASGGMVPMQDDWSQLREMVMNTDDPKALEDLNEIAGSRTELDALRKNWDELKKRAGTADPNQAIGRISLAIDAASKAGNAKRMAQLMDEMGKAESEIEAQHQEKVKAEAKKELEITTLMRSQGWNRQQAEDFYVEKTAGLRNQLRNITGEERNNPRAATINERPEMVSLLRRIDDIKESIKMERESDVPNKNAIRLLNQTLNGAQQEYERRYAALYGGGGGFAQTTSTTPAPGVPTQASSGDPMAAARAALGDNATIEQIEQWMEAQGL